MVDLIASQEMLFSEIKIQSTDTLLRNDNTIINTNSMREASNSKEHGISVNSGLYQSQVGAQAERDTFKLLSSQENLLNSLSKD